MKKESLKYLDKSPCFTKFALIQLHNTSIASLEKDIQNWTKQGILVPLKRGMYTLNSFLEKEKSPESLIEYIANKLVQPSYLSCDYVLQKHSLLTETIWGMTSVTTKTTRSFQNQLGSFRYYTVTPKLFKGYIKKPYAGNSIMEATKAKALFDYIYLRQYMFKEFSEKEVAELRINFDELTQKDWSEFRGYFRSCGRGKMAKILECLKNFAK